MSSTADEDDPNFDDTDNVKKLEATLLECTTFLITNAAPVMNVKKEFEWLNGWWIQRFGPNNLVDVKAGITHSYSDLLFMNRCVLFTCGFAGSRNRALSRVFDIFELTTEMAIWSSNHQSGIKSREFYNEDRVHQFYCRIANYVTRFLFHAGPIRMLEQLTSAELTPSQILELQVPARLEKDYIALQYTAPVDTSASSLVTQELAEVGINRYTREDAERDRRKRLERKEEIDDDGDANDDDDIPPPSRGWLWRSGIDDIVHNFIPLSSRLFHQLALQSYLISPQHSTTMLAHTVTPVQYASVSTWLQEQAAHDYVGTEFTPQYRNLLMEMRLPTGAREHLLRSASTVNDATGAQRVLENELGSDMAHLLNRRVKQTDYKEVAANEKHEFHDVFVLCMFFYCVKQTVSHIDLLRQSFAYPAKLESFSRQSRFGHTRRPIMTYILGKWRIHNWKKEGGEEGDENDKWIAEWYVCANTTEMIFQWLYLMETQFEATTDQRDKLYPTTLKARDQWVKRVFDVTRE